MFPINSTLNCKNYPHNTTISSFDATSKIAHSLLMVENEQYKDFADRLKEAMQDSNLKIKDVQEITSVSYEMARRYTIGKALPRSDKMELLAIALGVDAGWLQYGTGNQKTIFPRVPNESDYALIPHYNAIGECGTGNMNEHVEIDGSLSFRRDWLHSMGLNPNNLVAFHADGDSMYPTITEGAVVLLDRNQAVNPIEGKVYAIQRQGNGLVIKRMFRNSLGWIYKSDNQNKMMYPDLEPLEDDLVIGRVVWQGGNGGL